jgi:hypothetical protein
MSVMDAEFSPGFESRFHPQDRIRIKDTIDPALYQGMSTIGNEAIVRAVREDRFGLPQIFIEWDKNHWTYNNAPDGWTFEDHFDIVERDMTEPSKQDIARQLASQFAEGMASLFAEPTPTPEPEPTVPQAQPQAPPAKGQALRKRLLNMVPDPSEVELGVAPDEVEEVIAEVSERLRAAEAFIVIAVERLDHPKAPEGMLTPYTISYASQPQAELLVSAHMAGLATQAYQELAVRAIGALSAADAAADADDE